MVNDKGRLEWFHDVEALKEIYQKLFETCGRTTSLEEFAKKILIGIGFTSIQRARGYNYDYDYDAERHGRKYAIEVKGVKEGREIRIRWPHLEELWRAETEDKRPMIMFVNGPAGEWFLYEFRGGIGRTA
jgi:hypothetical protein